MRTLAALALCVLPLAAVPQAAQVGSGSPSAKVLTLSFDKGLVTLVAQNVTLPEILAEWGRKGSVRIIDGDRISATPVTYEFHNAPETMVLQSLLRGVSGYMAAPRRSGGPAGASELEQIFVLPTSRPTSTSSVTTMAQQPQQLVANPVPINGSPDREIPPVVPVANGSSSSTPPPATAPAEPLTAPSVGTAGTSATPGVIVAPVKPGTPVAPGTIIK